MNRFVSVRGFLLIGGLALLSVSIIFNFQLFVSFSHTITEFIVFAIMGLAFDVLKMSFALSAGVLWNQLQRPILSIFVSLSWVFLTAVSMVSGFAFLSNMTYDKESESIRESESYKRISEAVVSSQAQADLLSIYASTTTVDKASNKLNSLKKELANYRNKPAYNSVGIQYGTVGSSVKGCTNPRSFYYSYCPKIFRLNDEIDAKTAFINEQEMKHGEYLSAVEVLAERELQLANLAAGGSVASVGNTFISIGQLLDLEPVLAKNYSLFTVSCTAEVFATLALIVFISMLPLVPVVPSPMQFGNAQLTNYVPPNYKHPGQVFVQKSSVGSLLPRLPSFGHWSANDDDQLIKQARKALLLGLIKPSGYGLRKWGRENGKVLRDSSITAFQRRWLEEGLIEECQSKNGSNTYRLIG